MSNLDEDYIPVRGYLTVGLSDDGTEVVVNHPDLQADADGVGHIVFSPDQARHLAGLLLKYASEIETMPPVPS